MKHLFKLFAMGGLIASSVSSLYAQPYYLAGNYNGWSNNGNQMTDDGPLGINGIEKWEYDITGQPANTYPGGGGNGNGFKITDGTWNNTWPASNLQLMYDVNGNATVYFYPGTITPADGWSPAANRVGYATNGAAWEVTGDFGPDWGDDPNAQMTLQAGSMGVYTNVYIIATPGTYSFKFKTPGTWNDASIGNDFGDNAGNGALITTTANQAVLFQLDLPNGRYKVGSAPVPPVTNQVIFAVDMTYQIQLGLFTPGSSVFVAGDFNGWPSANTGNGLLLTNMPPYNGGSNTNIYYGSTNLSGLPKSTATSYKFTQNDPGAQNGGWETSGNRSVVLLTANGTESLPVAVFSDLYPAENLSAPVTAFFSVDMSSAVGTDAHAFDPMHDSVYVNGVFANWYGWAGGANPASAPPGYQMIEQGLTTIYTNTITLPAGTPLDFEYKYGMDPGSANGGPLDDEAASYVNHVRVVRSTVMNPYVLATDTFANMYSEPYFTHGSTAGGNLSVGKSVGGNVPVTWLGRPGAHLQVNTSLIGGTWQDLFATDGTNWLTGYQSTNGFVSLTNWPAADKAFFRLIKQ